MRCPAKPVSQWSNKRIRLQSKTQKHMFFEVRKRRGKTNCLVCQPSRHPGIKNPRARSTSICKLFTQAVSEKMSGSKAVSEAVSNRFQVQQRKHASCAKYIFLGKTGNHREAPDSRSGSQADSQPPRQDACQSELNFNRRLSLRLLCNATKAVTVHCRAIKNRCT